jgi:hypothetical protein
MYDKFKINSSSFALTCAKDKDHIFRFSEQTKLIWVFPAHSGKIRNFSQIKAKANIIIGKINKQITIFIIKQLFVKNNALWFPKNYVNTNIATWFLSNLSKFNAKKHTHNSSKNNKSAVFVYLHHIESYFTLKFNLWLLAKKKPQICPFWYWSWWVTHLLKTLFIVLNRQNNQKLIQANVH